MARLIINKCVIPENTKNELFHTPIYANDIFVSGGKGLMWSEDGITWTKGTSTTITNINDINWETPIYANDIFVVYGKQGTTSYLGWSENGKTWTLGTGATNNATGPPIYANALFLCGATTTPIWSDDGKVWFTGTGGISNSSTHTPIFANNIYVTGTNGNGLMWSNDGKAWTIGTGITTGNYDKIIYANNVFVGAINNTATTTTNNLIYSNDGKAWTTCVGMGAQKWEYITFVNYIFIGSTTNAGMYWSENGINWVACTGIGGSGKWNKAIFHNGTFANNTHSFSANTTSKFGWSTNGKEWFESTTLNSIGEVATNSKWTNLMQNTNILVCGSSNGCGYAWSYDGKNYKIAIGDLIFHNPNIEKIAFTPMYIEISNTMQKIFVGGSNYGLYYLTFNGNEYRKLQDIMIEEQNDWSNFTNANGNIDNSKFKYKILGAMNWNRVINLINNGYYTTKEYNSGTKYKQAEIVKYTNGTNKVYYISQVNENKGRPLNNTNYWKILSTDNRTEYATYGSLVGQWQNDYGLLNEISENFKYKGVWNNTTAYARNNLVSYNGQSYIAIQDVAVGINPPNATYWLLAQKMSSYVGIQVANTPPSNMQNNDLFFKIVSFADATWETIIAIAEAGLGQYYFNVGDEKTITLTDSTTNTTEDITLQILGFNHDDLTDGTGKANITFGMKNLLATKYQMNESNTNVGGWGGYDEATTNVCKMRAETMTEYYNKFPADLQSVIKMVDKKTTAGDFSTDIKISHDKLFLFSRVEIFSNITQAGYVSEGTQYEYWNKHNTDDDRIKKCLINGTWTANMWWLRSPALYAPSITYADSFYGIFSDGDDGSHPASNFNGVCFGFCI